MLPEYTHAKVKAINVFVLFNLSNAFGQSSFMQSFVFLNSKSTGFQFPLNLPSLLFLELKSDFTGTFFPPPHCHLPFGSSSGGPVTILK